MFIWIHFSVNIWIRYLNALSNRQQVVQICQKQVLVSYTLRREYRVTRNQWSLLVFSSKYNFCANLCTHEDSSRQPVVKLTHPYRSSLFSDIHQTQYVFMGTSPIYCWNENFWRKETGGSLKITMSSYQYRDSYRRFYDTVLVLWLPAGLRYARIRACHWSDK